MATKSFQLILGRSFFYQHLTLLGHVLENWNLASTPGLPHLDLYLNLIILAFERALDADSLLCRRSLWFIFGPRQPGYGFFLHLGLGVVPELEPYLVNLTLVLTLPSLWFGSLVWSASCHCPFFLGRRRPWFMLGTFYWSPILHFPKTPPTEALINLQMTQ